MGMKVCKLVRLTNKGAEGKFLKTGEGQITERKKAVISEETVKEFEDTCETSGLLYIVNEKLTKQRDAIVDKEVSESRVLDLDVDIDDEENGEDDLIGSIKMPVTPTTL
jgi:hypothetical protein